MELGQLVQVVDVPIVRVSKRRGRWGGLYLNVPQCVLCVIVCLIMSLLISFISFGSEVTFLAPWSIRPLDRLIYLVSSHHASVNLHLQAIYIPSPIIF